jgi:hypothetical protein
MAPLAAVRVGRLVDAEVVGATLAEHGRARKAGNTAGGCFGGGGWRWLWDGSCGESRWVL